MSIYKFLSVFLKVVAFLLSDVMCALAAYKYCDMLWGIKYEVYGAPASVSFLLAIPFVIVIIVCVVLSVVFRKKMKNNAALIENESVQMTGGEDMNIYKVLSVVFEITAVLLSDVMCALVAYNYCDMLWGIKYEPYSAPASVAFVFAIPFVVGIAICVILTLLFRKKIG